MLLSKDGDNRTNSNYKGEIVLMAQMQWANALSTRPSLEAAVADAVERAASLLQAPADLALVFISSAFTSEYPRLLPLLQERLSETTVIIGCGGGGIIGMTQEDRCKNLRTLQL
jgi:small ligand-binding sensory domain FIST